MVAGRRRLQSRRCLACGRGRYCFRFAPARKRWRRRCCCSPASSGIWRHVLNRQPNYTCLETIERSRAAGQEPNGFNWSTRCIWKWRWSKGRSCFPGPASGSLRTAICGNWRPRALSANGSFRLARPFRLPLRHAADYLPGRGDDRGRTVSRYDYVRPAIPQRLSDPNRRSAGHHRLPGIVLERCGDARSGAAGRGGDRDPAPSAAAREPDSMRYERVPIGDSTFLLPKSSEMIMEDFGRHTRAGTRSAFRGAVSMPGESTLSFDEVPEDGAAPTALAGGHRTAGRPVDRARIADTGASSPATPSAMRSRAACGATSKRKGVVLVPKGALLKGNVALLERRRDSRGQDAALWWRCNGGKYPSMVKLAHSRDN